ncbi:MAG TPA: ThuA domain-containing protein [Bryobacteraceae bacterium]|nr:ThuA domain-containing protein [Bryobacteraceae bacterium]
MRPVAVLVLLMAALANAQDARLRVLIVTGRMDPSHDWRETTPVLKTILENAGRFDVTVTEDARGITTGSLARYDAVLVHYNGPRFGDEAESTIEQFVRGGKGLISLHGVSYGPFFGLELRERRWQPTSEGAWPAWPAMLGATWKPENIGHGARHVFPVKWVDREHPIARGVEASFLANDELYHRLDLRPEARVIAAAFSDLKTRGTGDEEPIIWTVACGSGRTVHTTLGHDAAALRQPGVAAAIARAAEWAATGAVRPR